MYVTLESFQKYSNVYNDNIQLQESYIESAEGIVEDYLGYKLSKQEYKSELNGNGTNELQLKAKPIIAIQFVKINGKNIDVNEFFTENEFIYYKDGIFPEGFRNIIIWYKTGYVKINKNTNAACNCNNNFGTILDGGNANNISGDFTVIEEEPPDEDMENETDNDGIDEYNIPKIILMTILRLASVLQTESDGNIAVTSKSFGESGNRTFLNTTDYYKYLVPISSYRLIRI